jgi:hypothetical protein
MSNEDFGQFTVGTQHKPVAGIVNVEIPKALADLLAEHVPAVLKSSDLDLTLSARDEKTAKILAGYVKATSAAFPTAGIKPTQRSASPSSSIPRWTPLTVPAAVRNPPPLRLRPSNPPQSLYRPAMATGRYRPISGG